MCCMAGEARVSPRILRRRTSKDATQRPCDIPRTWRNMYACIIYPRLREFPKSAVCRDQRSYLCLARGFDDSFRFPRRKLRGTVNCDRSEFSGSGALVLDGAPAWVTLITGYAIKGLEKFLKPANHTLGRRYFIVPSMEMCSTDLISRG